jgi:thiamine biosynthesis lipoprotein
VLLTTVNFSTWKMTGTVAVGATVDLDDLHDQLWRRIRQFDDAANRFRVDSELTTINTDPGWHQTSPTMERLLDAASLAYAWTDGLCDPTVLAALEALGYDRDLAEVRARNVAPATAVPAPGFNVVERAPGRVRLSETARLDFGAVAKALLADELVDEFVAGTGALVEIGGDVAVRGEGPEGPWAIGVSDEVKFRGDEPRISLGDGGVATSSTRVRTWSDGARTLHHVIDPRTGDCANGPYATATVASSSCVRANALATAALLWGDDAPRRLADAGGAARLIRHDGTIEAVGGWHREEATCSR